MSEVHVRQLEQYLINAIAPSIDKSDLKGKIESDAQAAVLSRSLTAFAISGLTGAPVADTVAHVLDGNRDQGIDGCFFDETKNTLIFVQAKWSRTGTKTISKGDLLKFLHGTKLVLSAKWDTFSEKFKSHRDTIEDVLLKPDVQVIVAIAFTGDNQLSDECEEVLNQFEKEQNGVGDFLEIKTLDLRTLHRLFRAATLAKQQPFTAMLMDWGQATSPHQAVYGRICCEELAKLYLAVGEALFEPNIRSFLGDGEVNSQIIATLLKRPEDFWYLNNGITGISTRYSKTALGGGDNRQAGTFVFEGIQIVNGAQTIGSIARAFEKNPAQVSRAFVALKIISLEGTPLGFTDTVTVSTNRQNKVEEKDFLTLDPNQSRVRLELSSIGVQYVFRSGEAVVDRTCGFDVTEGVIALACSSLDIGNAVLAKRNIGLLLDKNSNTYQTLFSSHTTGSALWNNVQKLRAIEGALSRIRSSVGPRLKQIITHGNRVLAWAAFNADIADIVEINANDKGLVEFLRLVAELADSFIQGYYPEAYLAVFFKNSQKCGELATLIRSKAFRTE